ncbi:MAG: D-alanyl-D-alanine carboxypeptidase [Pseudomonadota bacterium]
MLARLSALLAVATIVTLVSVGWTNPAQANSRYASIVIDAYTGEVLSSDRADKRLFPASLTKIMTLFMVFEALEQEKVSLDEELPVSKRAAGMPPSKLHLTAGRTIQLEDAVLALVTKSANDAAVVIAERLGGSEIQFARKMTDRARQLGMRNTTFRNASGLPNRYQKSTARDMATLGRVLISRFPEYYSYFSTRRFEYGGRKYRNHNRLLGSYDGVDGIKTGYINASGFNLVASAQKDGRRIIGVVFGGRTAARRNNHMVKLLDRGFATASRRNLVLAGVPPIPKARPSSTTVTAETVTEERLLQVAQMQKPVFVERARTAVAVASLAERAAVAEPQPDIAPEDMLELEASPAKDPGSDTATPRLVIAGLGPFNGTQPSPNGQGDISPTDTRTTELEADHPVNNPIASIGSKPTAITSLLGGWSIQVGAFRSEDRTSAAIAKAISLAPDLLSWAEPLIKPIVSGRGTLYRARLAGLDKETARTACDQLERAGVGCLAVRNLANQ